MPPKRSKPQEFAIIAQRFSPTTFEEIDLIRWFNALSHAVLVRKQPGEVPADSRYHVAADALRWFTQRYRTSAPQSYCHLSRECVFTSLRVPTDLYGEAKIIADRDDVKLARVVETALRLYAKEVLTDKMRGFHARVQTEGSSLIQASLKRMNRRKASDE
jgi:hypothetical protein